PGRVYPRSLARTLRNKVSESLSGGKGNERSRGEVRRLKLLVVSAQCSSENESTPYQKLSTDGRLRPSFCHIGSELEQHHVGRCRAHGNDNQEPGKERNAGIVSRAGEHAEKHRHCQERVDPRRIECSFRHVRLL